jgi:ferrous-iron efflux pump FieF
MGVLAAAFDSVLDIIASAINFFSLRHAIQPPDQDHEYGHGKAESVAGMLQGVFIGGSGVYVISESVRRLIQGSTLEHLPVAVGVMGFAVIASAMLVIYLQWSVKKNPSMVLRAEALHYRTDILTNGGVVFTLILVKNTGLVVWDLVASLLIGFYILQTAFKLAKEAYNELMDKALPDEIKHLLENIILNFDKRITGYHKVRTRKVGNRSFIEFHVVIQGVKDFKVAHDLTESLIQKVKFEIPNSDVMVHADYEDDSSIEG